jgi:hypothetical protein
MGARPLTWKVFEHGELVRQAGQFAGLKASVHATEVVPVKALSFSDASSSQMDSILAALRAIADSIAMQNERYVVPPSK